MLKPLGLQPPTTWDELAADAKKSPQAPGLRDSLRHHRRRAVDLPARAVLLEQRTSLTNVDPPSFESALQLWVDMVKDGSASKSVLMGPDPDLTGRFIQGHAAMMVNRPSIFPRLDQKGWKYDDQYGVVPIPLPGSHRRAARRGDRRPGHRRLHRAAEAGLGVSPGHAGGVDDEYVTSLMYYLPIQPAVTDQVLKGGQGTRSSPRRPRSPGRAPPSTAPTTRRVAGHLDHDPGRGHRHLVG